MSEALFKHILVPVDLGETSVGALHFAGIFATKFGAKVTLLYADELATLFADYDPAWISYNVSPGEEAKRVQESIHKLAAEHLQGVEQPEIHVVPGHPIATISRISREDNVDLIVMGTHGRRGWRRALVGSVADGVVRESRQPVLVVPKRQDGAYSGSIRRIVCPVNFTDAAREAVRYAASLAKAFDAELILVHVAESSPLPFETATVDQLFTEWLPSDVAGHSSLRHLVLRGGPAERVLDCVEDIGADLLVMGAQLKWLRSESVIGTTSERLLRFANVPILTIARRAQRPAEPERVAEPQEARE
ncbi:MAG TPA: universal stress protein [Thermoanaerobaculia bacterium]|nr:universal stress protein [Thermoanaerobaculia bacterium]